MAPRSSKPPEAQAPAGRRRGSASAAPDSRRILGTIAASLAVLHVAQLVVDGSTWGPVVAFAGVAAGCLGWRLDVFRSVRTAVVLLVALSLACVLATLTVQRPQLASASEQDFQQTAEYAWAHLLVKVTHPWPRDAAPSTQAEQQLAAEEAVLGAEAVEDSRSKLGKSAIARADQEAARELAQRHPRLFGGLFRVADGLRFTDAYNSWWFIGLFYLLVLNLSFGALARRRVNVRNLGFHAAHVGLILVVAGATGSAYLARRGFAALTVGNAVDAYRDRASGEAAPLGFTLRLDTFETRYHEDLFVEVGAPAPPMGPHGRAQGEGGLRHALKIEPGKVFPVTDPESGETWSVTLSEIADAAGVTRTLVAADADEPGTTAVLLGGEPGGVWLTVADPPFIDLANRFKLRVLPAGREIEACVQDGRAGTFTLTMPGGGARFEVPVVPGTSGDLGHLQATFLQVVPDFRVGAEGVTAADFPRNPALRVRLVDEAGGGGDYLFFSDPNLKGFTTLPWDGLEASFDYDYWCTPTGARIAIHVSGDGEATADVSVPGGEVRSTHLAAGGSVTIGDDGPPLRFGALLPRAREDWLLVPSGEGGDGLHTALSLSIEGASGSYETWLLEGTPRSAHRLGGDEGNVVLRLAPNRDRPPRDWRSHVSVLEEGRVVHEQVVEVNEPLAYAGVTFFQSDADPNRPDYSGLQVVRDPAWPLVAVGLWALLLGIAWCFYAQPAIDRWRARARGLAEGGGR